MLRYGTVRTRRANDVAFAVHGPDDGGSRSISRTSCRHGEQNDDGPSVRAHSGERVQRLRPIERSILLATHAVNRVSRALRYRICRFRLRYCHGTQPGSLAACFTHAAICDSSRSPSWMST